MTDSPSRLRVKRRHEAFLVIVSVVLLTIAACSGDDGTNPGPGMPVSAQGTFLDAVVTGLSYVSGSASGMTDALGMFVFERGSTVTLRIGDIVFGQGAGKFIMTPVDLVPGAVDESNSHVTNRVRFLLTLDDDGIAANGIQITQTVRDAAAGRSINFDQTQNDFASDSNVQQVVAALTVGTAAGQRPLVSAVAAQVHLQLTLLGVFAGSYGGDYYADDPAAGKNRGAKLGEWFFMIDTSGSLSGALLPLGGGQVNLSGTAFSSGVFDAAAAGGLFFTGQATVDSSEDIIRVGNGLWFDNGEPAGTFIGEKQN